MKKTNSLFAIVIALVALAWIVPAQATQSISVKASVGGKSPPSGYPYTEIIRVVSGEEFTLDARHSLDSSGKSIVDFNWQDLTNQTLPSGKGIFPIQDNSLSTQTFTAPIVDELITYGSDLDYVLGLQVMNEDGQWSRSVLVYVEVEPKSTGALSMSKTDDFLIYTVDQDTFDLWATVNGQSPEGRENIKQLTRNLYNRFEDKFDQLWVFVEGPRLNVTAGTNVFVKTDTKGIGLSAFDDTASYGSGGKLEAVSVLYGYVEEGKRVTAMHLDASLHEFTHRWANHIVPGCYEPGNEKFGYHWPCESNVEGLITQVGDRMSPIEMYLAGFISRPDGEDAELWNDNIWNEGAVQNESLALFEQWSASDNFEPRVPSYHNAQRHFRGAVIVVTMRDELPSDMSEALSFNIANFSRSDGQHKMYTSNGKPLSSMNFWYMLGGDEVNATIEMSNLSELLK
ncbi:hypothetical protein [Vibrio coralliilyticus]|uniref:hypothetical protein n=1 Tax=Vibrio coralliilyticus TaxID=190893 RepID=UPI00182AE9CD|nr:hypothetical protein [Vibrio coralliilyticus]NUW70662.1 hypothetical protein [Vibrio coralliilyticus]